MNEKKKKIRGKNIKKHTTKKMIGVCESQKNNARDTPAVYLTFKFDSLIENLSQKYPSRIVI